MSYYVGALPRITVAFTSVPTGLPADPTTVALVVIAPDGTTTIYGYNPGPIVWDSIGNYHYDLTLTQVGNWQFEWQGTGTVTAVTAGLFSVTGFPTVSWSYSGNPASSPKDEVRFLIGDTNSSDPQLQDGEISYTIGLVYGSSPVPANGNYVPAIYCADALIAKYARAVSKSVGDLHVTYSDRLKQYQELAARLRMRATLAQVQFNAGGESIGEKIAAYANWDLIQPAVKIDGMDYQGTQPGDFQTGNPASQTTIP